MKKLLVGLILMPALVWAEMIVEGNSIDAINTSLVEIADPLPEHQQDLLIESYSGVLNQIVANVMLKALSGEFDRTDKETGDQLIFEQLSERISGRTAKEIITLWQTDIDAKARVLQSSIANAVTSEAKINFIHINNISYKIDGKNSLNMPKVLVSLEVTNNTEHALSTIYLMCSLKSPDRQTPWLREKIVHKIPGGIETGETLSLVIEPESSEWGDTTVIADDSEISAVIYQVDDAHGQPLWMIENDVLTKLSELEVLVEKSEKYKTVIAEMD